MSNKERAQIGPSHGMRERPVATDNIWPVTPSVYLSVLLRIRERALRSDEGLEVSLSEGSHGILRLHTGGPYVLTIECAPDSPAFCGAVLRSAGQLISGEQLDQATFGFTLPEHTLLDPREMWILYLLTESGFQGWEATLSVGPDPNADWVDAVFKTPNATHRAELELARDVREEPSGWLRLHLSTAWSGPVMGRARIQGQAAEFTWFVVNCGAFMNPPAPESVLATGATIVLRSMGAGIGAIPEPQSDESEHKTSEPGAKVIAFSERRVAMDAAHDISSGSLQVEGISFVEGQQLETMLRKADARPASIFMLNSKLWEPDSDPPTCLVGVLHCKAGRSSLEPMLLDELAYFHLSGRITIRFEGAEAVTLDATRGPNLLWLPSYPDRERGLPGATLQAEFPWAAGIVVFSRTAGLYWKCVDLQDRVSIERVAARSGSHLDDYWRGLSGLSPALFARRSPFVTRVPTTREDLVTYFSTHRLDSVPRDPHHEAREANQVDYACLQGWSSDYRRPRFHATGGLKPIADFRILRFPRPAAETSSVRTTRHDDGYEVIVPLVGAFRCVEIHPRELHDLEDGACTTTLAEAGIPRERWVKHDVKAAGPGLHLPDYVAVHSDAILHGFTVSGEEDAYALHIRKRIKSHPRTYRNASSNTRWGAGGRS